MKDDKNIIVRISSPFSFNKKLSLVFYFIFTTISIILTIYNELYGLTLIVILMFLITLVIVTIDERITKYKMKDFASPVYLDYKNEIIFYYKREQRFEKPFAEIVKLEKRFFRIAILLFFNDGERIWFEPRIFSIFNVRGNVVYRKLKEIIRQGRLYDSKTSSGMIYIK